MSSSRRNIFAIVLVGLVILGISLVKINFQTQTPNTSSVKKDKKDIYYCPMHPTYTSDRPGDCPICNMKLVKKEDPGPMSPQPPARQRHDICYLHNCPKVHDGKPCPMLVVAKEGERVTCPVCGTHVVEDKRTNGARQEKRILYWTDPMTPGYKSDKPGKSPMGMDLVPVYEEEQMGIQTNAATPEGYASILLTPQKQQLIGIKTAPVESKKLTKTIRTVGTIAHDPELYQAQAEYIEAIRAYARAQQGSIPEAVDQSRRLVESSRIRLKHLGLSDELIDETATWQGPEHGLLFAHPGDPVWMYAQAYEYELPMIHIGDEITVDVPSLPGEDFQGVIRAIDPMVDSLTRTTRIRAKIEDRQGHLKPDMYVNAIINVDLGETLSVPEEAVFNTGAKQIVFVEKGEGILEPRDVTLGVNAQHAYQVKEGLLEGEMVVTSGNFLIDSESRLKAALEGMAGGGGHQHGQ